MITIKKNQFQNVFYLLLWSIVFLYSFFSVVKLNDRQISRETYSLYRQGLSCIKLFKLELAKNYFTKALKQNPNYLDAYITRAYIYRIQGNYKKTIADLDQALTVAPYRVDILIQRGKLLYKAGDLQRAIKDYDAALKLNKRYWKSHIAKASLYLSFSDFKEAQESINNAFQIYPQSVEIIRVQFELKSIQRDVTLACKSGLKYLSNKQYELAVGQFGKALHLCPNASLILYYRAMVFKKMADNESALGNLSKAIRLARTHHIKGQPKLFEFLNQRGVLYAEEKKIALAINDFTEAIELNNDFVLILT